MERLKSFLFTHISIGIPVLVLCIGTITTLLYYRQEKIQNEAVVQKQFQSDIEKATRQLEARLDAYVNALYGGKGLFAASDSVSRTQWKYYAQALNLQTHYPGIQGIGYAQAISPSQLKDHIKKTRAEGFPQYSVWPEGQRDVYVPIVYLEPFDARNARAFGYDMLSNHTRKVAMERARDTGKASLSGIVTLVQELATDRQNGFLIYVPVYDQKKKTETIEDKRKALLGYVFSPFRIDDFVDGVFEDHAVPIGFHIYDDATISESTRMYDSRYERQTSTHTLTAIKTIDLYGRKWAIQYYGLNDYQYSQREELFPLFILLGGFTMTFLIALILFLYASSHQTAKHLAYSMTQHLDRTRKELLNLIEHLTFGVALLDGHNRVKHANRHFLEFHSIDIPKEDYIGKPFDIFLLHAKNLYENPLSYYENTEKLLHEQKKSTGETLHLRDGRTIERDYIPIYIDQIYEGCILIFRDVTDNMKRAQEYTRTIDELERINRAMVGRELRMVELKNQLAKFQKNEL